MSEPDTRPLTPANQNPWYVLMTLYGEQEGEEVDHLQHSKNRAAWNAWAGQGMSDIEREAAAMSSVVPVWELHAWKKMGKDIVARHEQAWESRNPNGPKWAGLPKPNDWVNFGRTHFTRNFNANGIVFPVETVFEASVFGGNAQFHLATFRTRVWFSAATFSKLVSFNSATFKEETRFDAAKFKWHAQFGQSNFNSDVTFFFAKFDEQAFFNNVTFDGNAQFDSMTFSELTYFFEARFGRLGEDQKVSFRDTHFSKRTDFGEARFYASYPNLQGAVLHPETTFTAKAADKDGPFWPPSPTDPIAAKDSCAKIRNNLGKQGFPEDEHFFYRREMRFAGLAASNPVEKLAYALFGLLSDYGYSFVRPIGALAAVFAFGLVAYWGAFLQFGVARPLGTAFGLSFSNLFPYFGLGRFFDPQFAVNLPPVLKVLGGIQTVSGAVLLFLMALGLRTRFRMR